MQMSNVKCWAAAAAFSATAAVVAVGTGCTPKNVEQPQTAPVADGAIDPAQWAKTYPVHYELWKKTEEPTVAGKSRYKKGYDEDRVFYDKLDEFPFLALLYNGWGFGIEYKEPRGHAYMLHDQFEVDPARIKAGGSCLTCKTPYAPELQQRLGKDYFSKPFKEVHAQIPKEHQMLGVACIDCHSSGDMTLKISRSHTLGKALDSLGVDRAKLTAQDKRSLVCAQCHVTYAIPKDANMKSTDVVFPWDGSTYGGITIENIIRQLRSSPANGEWTQGVTGFKLGFIRHPEFEFYSNNSVHWQAGVSCADCHMPATTAGGQKVSDHRIMSPLKDDLKACAQCHAEPPDHLRGKVYAIQDQVMSRFIRAGYATAAVAKLFEITNKAQASGKAIDKALYAQARDHYEEAFYRVVFIGAENSVGFHNPAEALRVTGDAASHAAKADGLLRQALAKAGVTVPTTVDLELDKYVNNRGTKKLMFNPEHEIKDPFAGK